MSDTAGQELVELIRQGRMIEAIKLVREQTGCGLVEAKAAVDKLQREVVAGSGRLAGEEMDKIRELLRAGRKIEAIKLHRQQTGAGLKEAKDAVDAIESEL